MLAALQALEAGANVGIDVAAVCAGITKVSRTGILTAWETALAVALPQAARRVVPDYVTAFHGALPGGIGVVVASGTGSVVYGENGTGGTVRIGGRGWEFGDEGSGAWLTTEVIRRTVRACDGLQPASPLTEAVCKALGTQEAGAFAEAARRSAAEYGRGFLTPLALALARTGNVEAANLFVGSAGWLSLLARTALRKLEIPERAAVSVAVVGGMWEAGNLLLIPFTDILHRHQPNAVITPGDAPPLRGAIRLACRDAGVH
jgi:N-acetylglucosamine kinase-like BadF-type ATPase